MTRLIKPLVWFWSLALATTTAHGQGSFGASAEPASPQPPATDASPDSGAYPTSYVARPITLARGLLRADASVQHLRIRAVTPLGTASASTTAIRLGAGFGITGDIEAGLSTQAIANPLSIAQASWGGLTLSVDPEFEFGDIGFYGRYRLLRGQLELALEGGVNLPLQGAFAFWIAAPLRYTMGALALDTGLALGVQLPSGGTLLNVLLPLRPRFAVTPSIYAGLDTGLQLAMLDGDGWAVPLGLEAGYVLATSGNPLDLFVNFAFPLFLAKGADGVTTELWTLMVGARFHTLVGS